MIEFLLGGALGPEGRLAWTSPQWVVVIAVAVSLLVWGLSLIGTRRLLARAAEAVLVALALAPIVVALAGPMWIEEKGRQEPGRIAVLVDASRSMDVEEGGVSRSGAVQGILDQLAGPDVDVYHFGTDLAIGPPTAYDLDGTDVEGALDALSERVGGDRLRGVVLISDGIDRGTLRKRYQREPDPRPPELPGPLTVYEVGTREGLRDLSVRSVDAGGFAFKNAPVRVRARILGVGFEGGTIPVTLKRDGRALTSVDVKLDASGHGEAEFVDDDVTEVGRFTYSVHVPKYEGDAVEANNAMPVVVRVVRDNIRVLQVAGSPSWDVKFLRRFLKGDPSVDLVSFFILRTESDIHRDFNNSELSLIEFPHEKLFSSELATFDLVIFQNFDHAPYFKSRSNRLLQNIRDYVVEGGHGFVMIGGNHSFDLGAYGRTPLGDVLPVELGLTSNKVLEPRFRPALTDAGRRHPVTRLAQEAEENLQWWDRLAPMDGANRVLKATEDATTLLAHPTELGADGKPLPVLSVREAGRGRAMALTVDASWRWSMSEAAQGRGNQAYLRFWKNAFRWLMKDPTTSRVDVDTTRENYGLNDTVRIVVRARDVDFAPLPAAKVKMTLLEEGGTRTVDTKLTDRDGQVVFEVDADTRGAHRVSVEVTDDGTEVGEAATVFAVTTRDPELDEVAPDAEFLRWLAESTKGAFYPSGEFAAPIVDPDADRTVIDRRETSLGAAPGLALLASLFAGLAWIVRRRSGLR